MFIVPSPGPGSCQLGVTSLPARSGVDSFRLLGVKATVLYTLARIAVFVVPFAILISTGMSWLFSAIIAAAIGFLLSYILLGRLRTGMATTIAERRAAPERDEDADLEDAALDGGSLDGPDDAAAPRTSRGASRTAPPAEDD